MSGKIFHSFTRRLIFIYRKVRKKLAAFWRRARGIFDLLLNAAMLIFLIEYIGLKRGIMVFVGFYAVFAIILIIRKREQWLNILRYMEGFLFGRPLDKEMWPEGFNNRKKRKIKIVWKKKDKGDNDARQKKVKE